MNIPTREQLETRMHALVADHLDQIAQQCPEGFDLGIIAFVVEVMFPDPETAEGVRREEGGYWPPSPDALTYQHVLCTDRRAWVAERVLRNAYELVVQPLSDEANSEDAAKKIAIADMILDAIGKDGEVEE